MSIIIIIIIIFIFIFTLFQIFILLFSDINFIEGNGSLMFIRESTIMSQPSADKSVTIVRPSPGRAHFTICCPYLVSVLPNGPFSAKIVVFMYGGVVRLGNRIVGELLRFVAAGSSNRVVSLVIYNVKCFRILIGGSYEFYSTWMAQIPIRLGGLGLRCQADLAQIAYTSALEKSLPYFGGENGICQPLAHLGGADEEGVDTRWRQLVLQGSQLSVRPVLRSLGWRSEGCS